MKNPKNKARDPSPTLLTMRRRAADNVYLHKDFHGALSLEIEYLHRRYGREAVIEYLRDFTRNYYAPLRRAIRNRGLAAIRDHLRAIYRAEGARADIKLLDGELIVRLNACPAVTHMRRKGMLVARMWSETTRTVNEAICRERRSRLS